MANFKTDLQFEESKKEFANHYYLDQWKATKIERQNWNILEQRDNQKKDIDLIVTVPSRKSPIKVSEKFSRKDYGNLAIELYSSENNPGWAIKSEADLTCIFYPDKVFVLNESEIKNLANNLITEYKTDIENMYSQNKGKLVRKYQGHTVNLHKIESNQSGRLWYGIIACIPYKDISEMVQCTIHTISPLTK